MSLFSSLRSASEALRVFDRSLEVVQNNVANASTPGYARQIQDVVSLPFDPALGLSGGVRSLGLSSSRNQYAEVAVRRQVTQEGFFDQKQASLGAIEPSFDVSGEAGIAAALSKLTQSFSSWSVNSNDPVARRTVLDRAQDLAGTFNAAANALAQTSADMQSQIRGTVDQINTLAGRLRDLNAARQSAQNTDAGLDANVQATLEELSELVGIQAIQQPDGSYTVLLGGQSPLVVGENQYLIGADVSVPQDPPPANPAGPPTARVLDAFGVDITGQVDGGRLAGPTAPRHFPPVDLAADQVEGTRHSLSAGDHQPHPVLDESAFPYVARPGVPHGQPGGNEQRQEVQDEECLCVTPGDSRRAADRRNQEPAPVAGQQHLLAAGDQQAPGGKQERPEEGVKPQRPPQQDVAQQSQSCGRSQHGEPKFRLRTHA
jgi:flagellar hook-associated protein FlgK